MTPRVGLVLGAGGTVGLAYHAGVLRALERVGGFVPNEADLVVGTSAGSLVAAYLRTGWTTEQFWDMALGVDEATEAMSAEELAAARQGLFAPAFSSPLDLMRRGIGSAYVIGRSLVRLPGPVMPLALRRAFPGGVFAMAEGRRRFAADLPVAWPEKAMWICTVNIDSGRRVVLGRGRRGAPFASLHDAVAASCAIPGLYPPVRIGTMTLVDGGAHSTSNLDLASRDRCDLIIGSIPMAFDTEHPPPPAVQLTRRIPARMLAAEVAGARRHGSEVLLFRPSPAELRIHGLNMMRRSGWDIVARAAYDSAARTLETDRFKHVLADLAA